MNLRIMLRPPASLVLTRSAFFTAAFIVLVFVVAVSITYTPAAGAQEPAPAAVETSTARLQAVSPSIWVPGTVISRRDSRIAAEVSGKLLAVAEVGQRLKQGEIIARMNDRALQLQKRDDEANIKRLQSNLRFLVKQVERVQKLAHTNNTAKSELDQLQMEREMLAQQLVAAEVRRDRTLYDIERSHIRAPFDGVVVERLLQPGEYIDTGNVVVRLVNLNDIEVKVQAPVSVSRFVDEGSVVNVKNDSVSVATRVRRLVPVGDERSRMLEVRVGLERGGWVIGEAVRVELANGAAAKRLTVPRDALILRDREMYVYKVSAAENSEQSIARRIAVTAGAGAGDYIAVNGDLRDGDTVVVRGGERLRDGQTVEVVKADWVANS